MTITHRASRRTTDRTIRDHITDQVHRTTATAVARRLAVPRSTMVAYLAGTARALSIYAIERRAEELGWGDDQGAS